MSPIALKHMAPMTVLVFDSLQNSILQFFFLECFAEVNCNSEMEKLPTRTPHIHQVSTWSFSAHLLPTTFGLFFFFFFNSIIPDIKILIWNKAWIRYCRYSNVFMGYSFKTIGTKQLGGSAVFFNSVFQTGSEWPGKPSVPAGVRTTSEASCTRSQAAEAGGTAIGQLSIWDASVV